MELLQSMPLNFATYASISTEITRGQIYSLFHENVWISQPLIQVKNSSQKQKNPHDQPMWGGITFQSSIYDRFPLKPGCVKNIPLTEAISVSLSLFKIQYLPQHLYWVASTSKTGLHTGYYNIFNFKIPKNKNN